MTSFERGDSADFLAQFYEVGEGAADVTGLTFSVTTVGGAVVLAATSSSITHIAMGLYAYTWPVPDAQAIGGYIALWQGSGGATASEGFTVTATVEELESLPFPDTGTRYVELPNGKPAAGQIGYVYQDAGLTVVAEAYADVNGTKGGLLPLDESGRRYLHTDGYGRQVDYWGPVDGTARLWIVINGVANPVDADYKARLDALGSRVSSIESRQS